MDIFWAPSKEMMALSSPFYRLWSTAFEARTVSPVVESLAVVGRPDTSG